MRRYWIFGAAGVGLLAAYRPMATVAEQAASPAKWEYKILKMGDLEKGEGEVPQNLTAGLNKLGGEGWELVAADGLGTSAGSPLRRIPGPTDRQRAELALADEQVVFVFKRAK